jgi:hypothetical protein
MCKPIEQKLDEEPGIGIGRLVNLRTPLPFASVIPLIKSHLDLRHGMTFIHRSPLDSNVPLVQVAGSEREVSSIASKAPHPSRIFLTLYPSLRWFGWLGV